MDGNKYVVIKLITGQELVAHSIEETDYDIKVIFPMIVRTVASSQLGRPTESIVLSPYSYFSAQDEYVFQKYNILIVHELDPKYEEEYNRAVDDFISVHANKPSHYDPDEIKKLTEKLNKMFKDDLIVDDDIDLQPAFVMIDDPKTIH